MKHRGVAFMRPRLYISKPEKELRQVSKLGFGSRPRHRYVAPFLHQFRAWEAAAPGETSHCSCYPPGAHECASRSTAMNILLVEDSDEVACITVEYLQELGHEVVAVAEAETALEQLKDRKFDAVMTDIRLPGMSGIDLARELTKTYPNLPVVIASGYGALNLAQLLGGAVRTVLMLPKPYDLPELERTLSEAAAIARH